jgi:prophage regulatory protein
MLIKKLYVDLSELSTQLSLSKTTIQRMVREKVFPPPRKLSGRRVAWLLNEIVEWAESRPVSDLPPPENTSRRKII